MHLQHVPDMDLAASILPDITVLQGIPPAASVCAISTFPGVLLATLPCNFNAPDMSLHCRVSRPLPPSAPSPPTQPRSRATALARGTTLGSTLLQPTPCQHL
jgi:hypothetical protein